MYSWTELTDFCKAWGQKLKVFRANRGPDLLKNTHGPLKPVAHLKWYIDNCIPGHLIRGSVTNFLGDCPLFFSKKNEQA